MTGESSDSRSRRQDAQHNLSRTWADFNRALRSVEPFDQWHWMRLLFVAVARYVYHQSRWAVLVEALHLDAVWRPLVPALGLSLIAFVVVVYFAKLREPFVVRAFCKPCEGLGMGALKEQRRQYQHGEASCVFANGHTSYCAWDVAFSFFAIYFGIMIIYHYIHAVFSSPGVILSGEDGNTAEGDNGRIVQKCMDARGGCCFINTSINAASERRLVAMYPCASTDGNGCGDGKDSDHEGKNDDQTRYFPSPFPSYCKKCNLSRPARAHHCSTCNRCVLQFDHHCPWTNNCIGFGNYRSFFMTILYVTLGAWYGFLLLAPPFFRHVKSKFQESGFTLLYKTGLLDLPPLWVILKQGMTTGIEPDILLRMVVPLLIGACLVMTSFLVYHSRYICLNLTTLEHSINLAMMKKELDEKGAKAFSETFQKPINPFDQGWRRNMIQTVGPSLLAFVLPISVLPRTPMAPKRKAA